MAALACDSLVFETWCAREGVDPDEPDAWDRFERGQEDARDAWLEARAEDQREAAMDR